MLKEEKLPTERNIMEIAKSEIPKLNLTLNLRRALELMLSFAKTAGAFFMKSAAFKFLFISLDNKS